MRYFVAKDYSRLRDRENRLYEFAGLAFNGLVVPRIIVGVVVGFALFLGTAVMALVLRNSVILLLALPVSLAGGVAGYMVSAAIGTDDFGLKTKLYYWFDATFRQPTEILGFAADKEVDQFHWTVTPWAPATDDWFDTADVFHAHYTSISH